MDKRLDDIGCVEASIARFSGCLRLSDSTFESGCKLHVTQIEPSAFLRWSNVASICIP
jgi:hypothetical protein